MGMFSILFVTRICVLLTCLIPVATSYANIEVSPHILTVDVDQSSLIVKNNSDVTEYVSVTLSKIINPGVAQEQEQLEQVGNELEPTIYATPFKLVLGPRQVKSITFHVLKKINKELVYRLSIYPNKSTKVNKSEDNLLFVSLGYNVLVRQLPIKKIHTWKFECTASGIKLVASGTTRVEFSNNIGDSILRDDFNVYPDHPRQTTYHNLVGYAEGESYKLQCKI